MNLIPKAAAAAISVLEAPASSERVDLKELRQRYEKIHALIRLYMDGDTAYRNALQKALEKHGDALLTYAHWSAVEGVRKKQADILVEGFAAVALENFRTDYRDSLVVLSLLAHSWEKLGLLLSDLQLRVDELATPRAARSIRAFFNRPRFERSIQAMGYREGQSEHGFLYLERGETSNESTISS